MIHSEERERDVRELARQVVNMPATVRYSSSGRDQTSCPFCYADMSGDCDMDDLQHESSCAFLIAKDVIANINEAP